MVQEELQTDEPRPQGRVLYLKLAPFAQRLVDWGNWVNGVWVWHDELERSGHGQSHLLKSSFSSTDVFFLAPGASSTARPSNLASSPPRGTENVTAGESLVWSRSTRPSGCGGHGVRAGRSASAYWSRATAQCVEERACSSFCRARRKQCERGGNVFAPANMIAPKPI